MDTISTKQMIAKIKAEVKRLGGVTKAAKEWDVLYQRVSGAVAGRELPPPAALKALGYEHVKTINYRYKEIEQ